MILETDKKQADKKCVEIIQQCTYFLESQEGNTANINSRIGYILENCKELRCMMSKEI